MIKTHKPRGHIWTNASGFQQTKEYRNITFEECTPKSSEILYQDTDNDLSKAQRSAKRRRIERLADDFLNGVPLFISSARPCPQSLRSTIVWNKKSSDEPKFSLTALESLQHSDEDEAIWEGQESTAEILERLKQERERTAGPDLISTDTATDATPPQDVSEIIEAHASCGASQRPQLRIINARPSEEALRQAAALRSRRLQHVVSETLAVENSIPCTAEVTRVDNEISTEPPLEARNLHPTAWLSRCRSKFSCDGSEGHDDSIEQLQLSGSGTRPGHQDAQPQVARMHGEKTIAASEATIRHQSQCKEIPRDDTSSEATSYHTASEQSKTVVEPDPFEEQSQNASPKLVHTAQVPSCDRSSARAAPTTSVDALKQLDHSTPHRSSTARVTRSATLQRARLEETTKSLAPSDHVSAIQSEPKPVAYITAQRSQNGSTPLAYRRGRLPPRKASLERRELHVHEVIPVESSKATDERLARQDSVHGPNEVEDIHSKACNRPEFLPEKWAGTQFLLNEAQRDLIVSPVKRDAAASSEDHGSSLQPMETPRAEPSEREPLKQLSQEPLPSTQQLIDNFEGWSTIRKPRAGPREPLPPTPTATGKSGWIAINASRAEASPYDPNFPKRGSKMDGSKLRFSLPLPPSSTEATSTTESIEAEQQISKPSPPKTPTPTSILRFGKKGQSSPEDTSRPSPSAPTTDGNLTFSTLTSAPFLSSFQPGQVEGMLSREPSNLSETIDDLTRDVLNMDDIGEVLSQVG